MSFSGEQTYRAAVALAEGTRQQSKAAAFVTYAYDPANIATYKTAIADADVAYFNSVKVASDALNDTSGVNGLCGPIAGAGWTPLLASA